MVSSSSNEASRLAPAGSLRAQNPEVYYSDDAIVTADDATIAELKRIAAGRIRACAAGSARTRIRPPACTRC